MNKELESTLNTALQGLLNEAANAKTFLAGEIPEVAQQLLQYSLIKASILGALALLTLFLVVLTACWCIPGILKQMRGDLDWFGILMFVVIVTVGLIIGLTAQTAGCLMEVIKIYYAPKVWLLEYIRGMMQ